MFNHNIIGKKIYSDSGKLVGWVDWEVNAICKHVKASRHMLRKPPAWAWDKSIIEAALALNIVNVIVYDKESRITYKTSIHNLVKKGFEFERSYGRQTGLALCYWQAEPLSDCGPQQLPLPISR